MGPAWELTNDESSPSMLSPADIGDETNGAESQPNTSRADQQVRRSQRIRRPPQRLIATVYTLSSQY